ncbi:MAG: M14 family metallopeptidase [Gemmatimonadota bacterium]|nr:M14 family metallopeptidase [Gemmatimonadota bacterium]
MITSSLRRGGPVAVAVLAALLPGSLAAQASYRNHAALTSELQTLTGGSSVASLSSIATTSEGREVWVVEIANRSGAPLADRPAVLVVGNLSGDHVVGSSHALEIVRYLIEQAGSVDVRTVLDEQVVYVIPRLNPDGAEAMFGAARWDRTGNASAYDDDNDGRTDEDGFDDLNGDGAITLMRVPDPGGALMIDPDDPRLMKRADATKGETGTHAMYYEGADDDGDGFFNEDGPGGTDLDRNFQHEYPYWQADAGVHMVSEAETRGLMDFMISHRNIGAILTFGHTDNLVTPPNSGGGLADPRALDLVEFADASFDGMYDVGVFRPTGGGGGFGFGFGGGGGGFRGAQVGRDNDPSSGRRPSTTVHGDDQVYFTKVSDVYRELTGIERVGLHREPAGAFFEWGYYQFGIPSFSTQGWALPEAAGEGDEPAGSGRGDGGGVDAEVLGGLEGAGVDAFAAWSAYTHPQLGEVEIGGFLPYVTSNPPEADLEDLGRRHGQFVVRLAGMLPRVSLVDTEVTSHGGGVFTVEATIVNGGFFPTSLRHGVVSGSVQPTTIQIQVPPEQILSGAQKTVTVQQLSGSGTRRTVTWVIRGQPGSRIEIRVRSQKGGSDSATVTLG